MHIGERIVQIRKAQGISGLELAKRAGIGQATISQIETGKQSPSIDTLSKILDALNFSLADFFSDEAKILPLDLQSLLSVAKDLSSEQIEAITRMIQVMQEG